MERELILFADIGETRAVIIVPVHMLIPHGEGADPKTAVTVERPIDHHGFVGFGMAGNADYFIFHALEMAVLAGFKFQKVLLSKRSGPGNPGPQM